MTDDRKFTIELTESEIHIIADALNSEARRRDDRAAAASRGENPAPAHAIKIWLDAGERNRALTRSIINQMINERDGLRTPPSLCPSLARQLEKAKASYPAFDNWPEYVSALRAFEKMSPKDKSWHNDGAPSLRLPGGFELYIPWQMDGADETDITSFVLLIPNDTTEGEPFANGDESIDFFSSWEAAAYVAEYFAEHG